MMTLSIFGSMLLARQMSVRQPWACRSACLIQLYSQCRDMGNTLDDNGISWQVRHIYREYNQTADALCNQAIDDRQTNGPSAQW